MENPFSPPLLVPKQSAEYRAGGHPPSVPPVIDPRHQKAEERDPQSPSADLFNDGLSVQPSPALAVIEGGSDQSTYSGRCTYGAGNADEVGDEKPDYAAQRVDYHHAVDPVFAEDKGGDLCQGDHDKEYMEDAAVEVVSGDKGPPATKAVNGNGSGGSEKNEPLIRRG